MKILLIDDKLDFISSKKPWLETNGYVVITAISVTEAVSTLNKDAKDIDIALIDMYMENDQKAGLRIVELLTNNYPWIVPIILTGNQDYKSLVECLIAGAANYIAKAEVPPESQLEVLKRAEKLRIDNEILQYIKETADDLESYSKGIAYLLNCIKKYA